MSRCSLGGDVVSRGFNVPISCWDQALRRHALKPSPIYDCHDLSFRHSSDCHSYYRAHFLIVMTLFLDWRRPICHSSFVTIHYVTCHTPQRLSPLRLILSLSVLLRVPPSSDCTDCIFVLHSPSFHILRSSFHLLRTSFHGAGASRASHTSSGPQRRTRALGIRRAPTVLSSVRPVLQQE